ncbi:MAG TPA: helix-turn-helix domain-containing protein [Burkholderiaceae bacterium]|nr:helix-turn-helix domain-containing protein [Burkholderiaceae bacterium]
MEIHDHRPRVAAERRERMRLHLLSTALRLVAEKGPAALSIDDVVSAAEVARGTFYKYFASPDALVGELAVESANELIRIAEPVVQRYEDPAERVACGIRLVARMAIDSPVVASFVVRLGWPDVRGPGLLLDFVRRDLSAGIRQGRFKRMPITLALNIVAGAVLGAAHCMLDPKCEADFAEQTAAAALRALGVDAKAAERIATRPLQAVEPARSGLFAATLAQSARSDATPPLAVPPARAPRARRSVSRKEEGTLARDKG